MSNYVLTANSDGYCLDNKNDNVSDLYVGIFLVSTGRNGNNLMIRTVASKRKKVCRVRKQKQLGDE